MRTLEDDVTALCQTVMHGVAATNILNPDDDAQMSRAVEVLRSEIKLFVMGEGGWADVRKGLVERTCDEKLAVAALIGECVKRITDGEGA